MKFFIYGETSSIELAIIFSPLLPFQCYSQVDSFFTFLSDFSVQLLPLKFLSSTEMINLFVTIVVTKLQRLILLVTRSCSAGTLYCTQCPKLSAKPQLDLSYHIGKKQSATRVDVTFKCKICYLEFAGFYALIQHRNTQHGFFIKIANIDPDDIINEVDDTILNADLRPSQHFFLNSEIERALYKLFNYAKIVDEKLDQLFNNLKCASKVTLVFGFFSKSRDDGGINFF